MIRAYFWRLYVPKNERSEGVLHFRNVAHMYEKLNDWNRQQPGVWQYWRDRNQIIEWIT